MALSHIALDLSWQLQKRPESWRLEAVQEINLDNLWGWKGKGWRVVSRGSLPKTEQKTCLVWYFLANRVEICFWLLD